MKKFIIASVLIVTSVLSASAFALTSDQLNFISQERADYFAANGTVISWQLACNNVINSTPAQDKIAFAAAYPLETCSTADFTEFFACKDRNTANANTQSVFDTKASLKASIAEEGCSSLPL
ncbi:hypothetical protein [uncultured Shewanella sp.]|uniref:hypothetical protein n=1 Tax=uncultured Shewanella sp. TaxID=173975 RepID=UPI002615B764|nr:hypothetical protein [uncultured Shewanella sp.]